MAEQRLLSRELVLYVVIGRTTPLTLDLLVHHLVACSGRAIPLEWVQYLAPFRWRGAVPAPCEAVQCHSRCPQSLLVRSSNTLHITNVQLTARMAEQCHW